MVAIKSGKRKANGPPGVILVLYGIMVVACFLMAIGTYMHLRQGPELKRNEQNRIKKQRSLREPGSLFPGRRKQSSSSSKGALESMDCVAHMEAVHTSSGGHTPRDRNKGQLYARHTSGNHPFWISVHNKSYDTARWTVFRDGFYYETVLTEVFEDILLQTPKEDLVLDVGGNIGWFTLLSAAIGHDVHVFEPLPLNQYRMCQSLVLNRWMEDKEDDVVYGPRLSRRRPVVRLYPYGVGAAPGTLPLVGANPGAGTFVDSEERYSTAIGKWANISIVTLDQLAVELQWMSPTGSTSGYSPPRVAILKMDVEGYEPSVVKGAHKLLRTGIVRNILMEITNLGNHTNLKNMLADIGQAGYELHRVGQSAGPSKAPERKMLSTNMREQAKRIINTLVPQEKNQANLWWRSID